MTPNQKRLAELKAETGIYAPKVRRVRYTALDQCRQCGVQLSAEDAHCGRCGGLRRRSTAVVRT